MPGKRRTKKRDKTKNPPSPLQEYKPMKEYGVGDLLDEIWLNRVMLLRTTDKRNSADG